MHTVQYQGTHSRFSFLNILAGTPGMADTGPVCGPAHAVGGLLAHVVPEQARHETLPLTAIRPPPLA